MSVSQMITCPSCGTDFPLDQALTHRIEDELRAQFDREIEKQTAAHQAALQQLEGSYSAKFEAERSELQDQADIRAQERLKLQLEDVHNQLQERDNKLEEAQKAELELLRRQRELEESRRSLELQIERERSRIWDEASEQARNAERLRIAEKDKQLGDMKKQVDDLMRKLEQGSQQTQGEVLELELEHVLRTTFPTDEITPVPKGTRGADVLHRVCAPSQPVCGTILWETKRTKSWNPGWIAKLQEDRVRVAADVAVIVSEVLPKDVDRISNVQGVWVTDLTSCVGFATVLRAGVVQMAAARSVGRLESEEMEAIRGYLSGGEFSQRVEAIAQSFIQLKSELDAEKAAFERIWKKREKQIERGLLTTAGMYGALDGMLGDALPDLTLLELPTGN